MKVVVVGAGLAGLRTAEALRDKGFGGELVLVGAEPHLPYDRPLLSKQVLRGERDPIYLRRDVDYPALGLDLRLGTEIVGLDTSAREVHTGDGPIGYDVVVLATGAAPRRFRPAAGLLGTHVLRSLDDCLALRAELVPGTRLGIIGAGLIGCEVAASARKLGLDVSVVEVLSAPLVRALGEQVAELVTRLHTEHGVDLHLGTGVAEVQTAGELVHDAGEAVQTADGELTATGGVVPGGGQLRVSGLVTSVGTEVRVDVLLEAMGVIPAADWLAGSGLELSDGVGCDEVGQAAPGVFAVGDVARWLDPRTGMARRVEHFTRAEEQAVVVAAAVLGERAPLDAPPYWWSDQYDLKVQGLGWLDPGDDVELLTVGPKARTVAVYSRGGVFTGVVGFSASAVVTRLRPQLLAAAPVAQVLADLRG